MGGVDGWRDECECGNTDGCGAPVCGVWCVLVTMCGVCLCGGGTVAAVAAAVAVAVAVAMAAVAVVL